MRLKCIEPRGQEEWAITDWDPARQIAINRTILCSAAFRETFPQQEMRSEPSLSSLAMNAQTLSLVMFKNQYKQRVTFETVQPFFWFCFGAFVTVI